MNQSTKASSTGEKSSRYEKCQVIGATDIEYPRCENEKCELLSVLLGQQEMIFTGPLERTV
jgi:hypothetical protein